VALHSRERCRDRFDLTNMDRCERPITLRTDRGEEYGGFMDLRRHPVQQGDRVTATIKAIRVSGLGPLWIVSGSRVHLKEP